MLLVFDIPPSLSTRSLSFSLTHTNTHTRTRTRSHWMLPTLAEDMKMLLRLNIVHSKASNLRKIRLSGLLFTGHRRGSTSASRLCAFTSARSRHSRVRNS